MIRAKFKKVNGGLSLEYVLKTYGLSKRFGSKLALDNVSINIKKGEIYGLDPDGIRDVRDLIQRLNRECGIGIYRILFEPNSNIAEYWISALRGSTALGYLAVCKREY